MTSQEKLAALHEVKPGRLLHDMRYRAAGSVAVKGLREGIVSQGSPLADAHTHVFVSTNSSPNDPGEVAIAVEDRDGGRAMLSIETRADYAARNLPYLRKLIDGVAEVCHVDEVVIDPEAVTLEPGILEDLHLKTLEAHDHELAMAA